GPTGALAAWELRRAARRGGALRVRLLLLYVLFLAFVIFAAYWFQPLPPGDVFFGRPLTLSLNGSATFAGSFALFFLEVQLAAVVAVTPGLAAAAVAGEKDKQTLALLLTTPLGDREIVFAKALAQVALVLSALLAGLPVLLVTQLFGGVDPVFVLSGYAVTVGAVAACAAAGVFSACRSPDFRSAVVGAYAWSAVACAGATFPCVLVGPFAAVAGAESDPLGACGHAGVLVLVAGAFLLLAARSVRLRDATAGPPPATAFPLPPRPAEPLLFQNRPRPSAPLPPVDAADPVLWKERFAGWRPGWAVPGLARVIGAAAAAASVGLLAFGGWALFERAVLSFDPDPGAVVEPGARVEVGWLFLGAGVLAAGRYLLPVAVGVSGAVAGERRRGTLDLLLLTTLDRGGVLRAKVQAHAERGTLFVAVAVVAVGAAFMGVGGPRLGAAAAGLVAAGVLLAIAAGAWLTARCSGDLRAFRLLLPVVVLA
ncbi:MAG: ABC transporter permease subunit, partial [Gemmataceae bacterium]|nr:ABC transporter permease subunit [Gemmataceae bacterium]